jgi:hypothetical protein
MNCSKAGVKPDAGPPVASFRRKNDRWSIRLHGKKPDE